MKYPPRSAFGALATAALTLAVSTAAGAQAPDYLNQDLPFAARVRDLVGRMTLDEKVSQMKDVAPAIDRLGIPAYNWWNEALHGVARSGLATSFPQAIGLAATWDDTLMFRMASVISDEARAKYQEYLRQQQARPVRRPDVLVAQHQPLPRSAVGPRPGNLRRGSVPHRPPGGAVHSRHAGRRSEIPQDDRHRKAFRGAQRARAAAAHLRCHAERARPARELPAAIRRRNPRRRRLLADVRLQPHRRQGSLRQRHAAQGYPARRMGIPGLRRLRLRRHQRHLSNATGSLRRRPKPRRWPSSPAPTSSAAACTPHWSTPCSRD